MHALIVAYSDVSFRPEWVDEKRFVTAPAPDQTAASCIARNASQLWSFPVVPESEGDGCEFVLSVHSVLPLAQGLYLDGVLRFAIIASCVLLKTELKCLS